MRSVKKKREGSYKCLSEPKQNIKNQENVSGNLDCAFECRIKSIKHTKSAEVKAIKYQKFGRAVIA